MYCDFCSIEGPVYSFMSKPGVMIIGDIGLQSDAQWAACPDCAALVMVGDKAALVERSYEALGLQGEGFKFSLKAVQSIFWAGYNGGRPVAVRHE